jgi:hypothetical protein
LHHLGSLRCGCNHVILPVILWHSGWRWDSFWKSSHDMLNLILFTHLVIFRPNLHPSVTAQERQCLLLLENSFCRVVHFVGALYYLFK